MNREANHAAFKRWAEERLEDMRRRACIFCGYPTRHTSQTCPAHRDLAPPIEHLLLDAEATAVLEEESDGTHARMDRDRLGRFVAADPSEPAGRVDQPRP